MQVQHASTEEQESPRLPAGHTVITKRFTFDSAHYLPNVPDGHKCGRMHGHTYTVWLHVSGPVGEREGWVVDFSDLKTEWKPLEAELDHKTLNDLPGLENPTAENLGAWIWQRMTDRDALPPGVRLVAVEIAETPDSRALFVPAGQNAWVPGNPSVPVSVDVDDDGRRQGNGAPASEPSTGSAGNGTTSS